MTSYDVSAPPIILQESFSGSSINKKFKVKLEITLNQLKELKKEKILELLYFINENCSIVLENENSIDNLSNVFKIHKNELKNEYNIMINNNINEIKDKNVIDNSKDKINHNIKNPIICSAHKSQFLNLSEYLTHCFLTHKSFNCEYCGENFDDFDKFNEHLLLMKNKNNNVNMNNDYSKNSDNNNNTMIIAIIPKISKVYFNF